ncbi:hypothetical protein [Streptomyces fractus]|uniref:hypothetical protein n=1 Tax=Streptomyces fractus TaxID=641806 RepID=UPI003CF19DBD
MSGNGWVAQAPCVGDPRFTPNDARADTLRTPHVTDLLTTCETCPFRARCIALVKPHHSHFDGICGGRLWLDGWIRATCRGAEPGELDSEGEPPIVHGTEAGARAHHRRGEEACTLCREGARIATAERRARRRSAARTGGSPKTQGR